MSRKTCWHDLMIPQDFSPASTQDILKVLFLFLLTRWRWSTFVKIINQKHHICNVYKPVAVCITHLKGRGNGTFAKQIVYLIDHVSYVDYPICINIPYRGREMEKQ